jgi:adenylate cyclase
MSAEDFKRKLTAVMSADVAGYSRLMAEDEAETVKTLNSYKEIMSTLIKQHRGRVVDSTGDNLLAEFASVVDAVQCAVSVQKEFQARNADLPENRRMEFRIGINLGDVIEEEDRIFGDGVNIAARLEALAEPGGICVSKTSFDHIESKLPLGYEYLGEQTVKNIPKPVGAYRVVMEPRVTAAGVFRGRRAIVAGVIAAVVVVIALGLWRFYLTPPKPTVEPASLEKMAFPLPNEPSIAVLPFTNLSGDPGQEYFSDGITEQIINALSKLPRLLVIARNSTFTYKGKAVKVQTVAEELGVQYVLEGSVQKAGEKVRITAQLVDALTGHHLWAERYDRDLKDIFALQDEITLKIMSAVNVKLTKGEEARLTKKETDNVEAYIKIRQGYAHFMRFNKEGNPKARKLAEEAIVLDPEYATAYCLMGQTHYIDPVVGLSKSPRKSYQEAAKLLQKALAIDESHPGASSFLAFVYALQRQHEKSLAQAERAVALYPNMAVSNVMLGAALARVGRYEEAIQSLERGIRLDPKGPAPFFSLLGSAYCFAGRYEEAIEAMNKAVERAPNSVLFRVNLAAIYSIADRDAEARAEVAEALRLDPNFSLDRYRKVTHWRKAELEPLLEALRKAGLPENPPLPLPDKPSIAVLPFVNMSGDPKQEYFSDGITETIITGLSKTPRLFVIARNSTFTYKGKPTKVQKVGRELGVRYVLEGSVQKSADRVRITAQLVDAKSGSHVWAEQYDRDLKEIFALQDEITMKIIVALQVKLTEGEHGRVLGAGTSNLSAYIKVLQARAYYQRDNKEDNLLARQLTEEAIALDPRYPTPYIVLGFTHLSDAFRRWSKSPEQSLAQVVQLAQEALSIDASRSGPHVLLGIVYLFRRQHEKAIAEMEQAVALAPNSDRGYAFLGRALHRAGRSDEAIPLFKKALRRNPKPESWMLDFLGAAYNLTGQYEEAIVACKEAIKIAPRHEGAHITLTCAYSLSGRDQEARAEAEKVLRINPKYCIRSGKGFYKNPADTELVNNALRKAGLPDCPPRQGSK